MKPFKKSFTKNEDKCKLYKTIIDNGAVNYTPTPHIILFPEGLKKAINEAKKEFPFFNPVEGIFNVEKSLEIYQKFTTEVLTWLNKWFGTPEKETTS